MIIIYNRKTIINPLILKNSFVVIVVMLKLGMCVGSMVKST